MQPGAVALGHFLRALRNRRQPQEVGLSRHVGDGAFRRVPGLRRQEVADLAGVSLDYYTRIEQGRAGGVSAAVLAALARALQISAEESAHLRRLAASSNSARSTPPQSHAALRPSLLSLAERFTVPTSVVTPALDVVSANLTWRLLATPPGQALVGDFNIARWYFLDPYARQIVVKWRESAGAAVAGLRVQTARHPGDERVQQVVHELLAASEDFRQLWAAAEITGVAHGRRQLAHPTAGHYTFDYETLQTPGEEGLLITVHTPVPGTGSEQVLDRLLAAHTRHTGAPAAPGDDDEQQVSAAEPVAG